MTEHQFLEIRQSLKEQIRKKIRLETAENGTDLSLNKAYKGSFFGPSQTVFATRLVQESNFFLEKLKPKILCLNASSAKGCNKSDKSSRLVKIQKIKESRDYLFLLPDNQEVKPIPPTKISPPISLGNNGGPQNKRDSKKVSVSKSNLPSMALRKKETDKQRRISPQVLPSKTIVANVENNKVPTSSSQKKHVEQKKPCPKSRIKLPAASSKPQENKPMDKQNSSQDCCPSKKRSFRQISVSEDEKAFSIIRRMFNTQRFAGRDVSDINMESSFEDIVKEEKRSERLGRKEDAEQLRIIQEEEERERMAKRHRRK